jgi:flagellar assembly factor FliW
MKVQELIELLREAPREMDVVFNYLSLSGEDDFSFDIDEAGIYPLEVENEGLVDCFCLNTVEPDLKEIGLNFDISMN